jgi:hypothetical protein
LVGISAISVRKPQNQQPILGIMLYDSSVRISADCARDRDRMLNSLTRIGELARQGFAWALPNLTLGALVIVPIWFVLYLFRPPGESRD